MRQFGSIVSGRVGGARGASGARREYRFTEFSLAQLLIERTSACACAGQRARVTGRQRHHAMIERQF